MQRSTRFLQKRHLEGSGRLAKAVALALSLTSPAIAQDISQNLGPVIPADKGWVQTINAGPVCSSFVMQPSGQTWNVQRGTPMHDDIMRAAKENADAWRFYTLATKMGVPGLQAPVVVVSASTSPPMQGSSHPGYDAFPSFQPSIGICGSAQPPYQVPSGPLAIAILPASGY